MLVDNGGAFGEGMCVVVGVDAGVLVGDVYGVVYLLRHLVLGVYVGMWGVKYLCVGTGDASVLYTQGGRNALTAPRVCAGDL